MLLFAPVGLPWLAQSESVIIIPEPTEEHVTIRYANKPTEKKKEFSHLTQCMEYF